MYSTRLTIQVARKQHRCTYCLEPIVPGEKYERWATYDIDCVTNKMHIECLAALSEDGEFEYVIGEGQRPAPGEFGRPASPTQTEGDA